MLTNTEKQRILDDMEEAWHDIRSGVRLLAKVYKCDYDTLFNAVAATINETVDIDNITKD